ncbi:hypothetical protein PG291_01830 [Riemerella anatipestifer]|nr:hypothetical protein [Riemerella anatipestifer]MDY3534238.1 hypothetical protein [Riemerella anatipestifer]MDY3536296.1 hypothetical protein [Riemerella anatipestifer]MDY3547340.1 hypothetical protein [Riemerella anatipestifer]
METQIKEKLEHFFTDEISGKSYARELRRFAMETIKMYIVHDENKAYIDKEWISEGHYWLHRLCEILDPQLEDEE